jgi:hypothetical protein
MFDFVKLVPAVHQVVLINQLQRFFLGPETLRRRICIGAPERIPERR